VHVLITDDGYKASLGVVRSLGSKGIKVSVLADSPMALASRSRYCSARYVTPPLSDPDFLPALIELLRNVRFDLVMPIGYTSTAVMALHKDDILPFTRLEIPNYDIVRLAADKHYVHNLAVGMGVPVPRTEFPRSPTEAVLLSAALSWPVVIKFPHEAPGQPVYYARTQAEFLDLYQALSARRNINDDPLPLIQEFVPGFGAGFFALYQEGICKRIFMHKRIREIPPSGGMSCCAESFHDPKLKYYGMRLLDQIGWHGAVMAEFRYDQRDGDFKLIEINPKLWGSLDLALAAGVDFPYDLCQIARGHTLIYSEQYDRNKRYHWPLTDMQHAFMRPSSLLSVLADLLRPGVDSNVWWSDLKPNLLEPLSRIRFGAQRLMNVKTSSQAGSRTAPMNTT